jgi:S-DNA-T family DNA segregation ATPase FtsK/SpoIIIE
MTSPKSIHRPPRIQPELPVDEIDVPSPPNDQRPGWVQLLQIGLPALAMIGFLVVSSGGNDTRRWTMVPMALSVVGSIGISIYLYLQDKKRRQAGENAYREQLLTLRERMVHLHELQRYFYRYNYPDFHELPRIIESALAGAGTLRSEARLWQRRPGDADFCAVRIGIGSIPSTVDFKRQQHVEGGDGLSRLADKLVADSKHVDEIPIVLRFRPDRAQDDAEQNSDQDKPPKIDAIGAHAVGIVGEQLVVQRFVRSFLSDYVTFHSPDDAKLCILVQSADEWGWARTLAHCQQDNFSLLCVLDEIEEISDDGHVYFDEDPESALEVFTERLRRTLVVRKMRRKYSESDDAPDQDHLLPFLLVIIDLFGSEGNNAPLLQLQTNAAISILLEEGDLLNAGIVCLSPTRRLIPEDCGAVIEVDVTPVTTSMAGETYDRTVFRYAETGLNVRIVVGKADQVNAPDAARVASLLGQLALHEKYGANLARSVAFLDIMGAETIDALLRAVPDRWEQSKHVDQARWLRARFFRVVGNKTRPLVFSADGDGVHGMVAGSTGAGKSELLISMLLSMAVTYSPEVLNFVLVDYKGGTAFNAFARLPHCVDVITNLGAEGVERMFASIGAELGRRQALNKRTDTKDIMDYRRRGLHLTGEPYPFLFIIIDEFAEMIASSPHFRTQLESITRTGRAQGVSLILAAQRPSGVSDQMRSNIKFRICLRVETPGESREMLRRADAAMLPKDIPGRGYLQVGNDEIEMVQVAYTGQRYGDHFLYEELIEQLKRIAQHAGVMAQHAPWPDFLPWPLYLDTVLLAPARVTPGEEEGERNRDPLTSLGYLRQTEPFLHGGVYTKKEKLFLAPAFAAWLDGRCGWLSQPYDERNLRYLLQPVIGLVDDPYSGRQHPLSINLRRGHAAIFGAPGVGKTSFLFTLAVALVSVYSPRHLHLYVMDLGGRRFRSLREFPHVGAVISPDEEGYEEQVGQLIRDMAEEVSRRKALIDGAGVTNLYEYNAGHPAAVEPAIVLLLDNFTEFKETFGESRDAVDSLLDRLIALLRGSLPYGIHFVLSASQPTELPGQLWNICTERFSLKQIDAGLYREIVGGSVLQVDDKPGRGYARIGNQAHSMQVAEVTAADNRDAVAKLNRAFHTYIEEEGFTYSKPLVIGALPEVFPFYRLIEQHLGCALTENWEEEVRALMRARWARSRAPETVDWLEATIGVTAGNRVRALHFKADTDGVHGLIAGGTGAGKSALLISLIMELSLNYDPSVLNFVLVDYKGGGAFKSLLQLPHCVQVVSNLGTSTVRRMFTSVRAELERRQQLLGTADIVAYRKSARNAQEPLPHLLIIIDEYAEMIAANQEFLGELESITRLGRSLGVHLLLASQRPIGVTDQMRDNIRLRLCLRVEQDETSREMLRRSDAARLPAIGGRGYLQVGNEEIELIQVAYLGSGAPPAVGTTRTSLFESILSSAQTLAGDRVFLAPWPEAIPSVLSFGFTFSPAYLPAVQSVPQQAPLVLNPKLCDWIEGGGSWQELDWTKDAMQIPIGLVDNPYAATQSPLLVNLRREHVAFLGGSGWGKTTFLQNLIISAAAIHSPRDLHIYVIDLGRRQLAPLAALPHVGPIIMPDVAGFEERVQQMLRDISQEIERRSQAFDSVGAADLYEYNDQMQRTHAKVLPAVLITIDNFDEFVEIFGNLPREEDDESVLTSFMSLAGRAKAYGFHFLVAASRPAILSSKLYSLFAERMTVRLDDADGYAVIVGNAPGDPDEIPGRGYVRRGHRTLTMQIASLPSAAEKNARSLLEQLGRVMHKTAAQLALHFDPPLKIDPLATSLPYRQFLQQAYNLKSGAGYVGRLKEFMRHCWAENDDPSHADWLTLLLGTSAGNRPRTLCFEAQKDGAHGMIAGGTGSGKSELLTTFVAGLALRYSPEQLNFVLVDYKGGGAFEPFRHLPHCVELLTNLDTSAVDRMFVALQQEIERRQALTTQTKTGNIVGYRKRRNELRALYAPDEPPPYPHLFVIIDEYAEMLSNAPEEYGAVLDSITRTGRAQGIHLILAAQKPRVSDQMRANIRLRICLRVEEKDTSVEILGRPDAVRLPSIPGRGYLQIGHSSIQPIQVAWMGETIEDDRPAGERFVLPGSKAGASADEEMPLHLYRAIVHLAQELVNERDFYVPRPWPPPMPACVGINSMLAEFRRARTYRLEPAVQQWLGGAADWPGVDWGRTAFQATAGIVDNPWQADQGPWVCNLRQGHWLIFGEPGSGKSTFLRTLAVTLAATHAPTEAHIHVIDMAGRGYAQIEALPHVGAVLYSDDETFDERLQRLLQGLHQGLQQRLRLLAEHNAETIFAYNQTHRDRPLPAIVLLIDNLGELYKYAPALVEGRLYPLLARASGTGIAVVSTNNTRSGLPVAVLNFFSNQLTFRHSDPDIYFDILGQRAPVFTALPGRGYLRVSGERPRAIQAALPLGPDIPTADAASSQAPSLDALVDAMASACARHDWTELSLLPNPVAALPLSPLLTSVIQNSDGRTQHMQGVAAVIGVGQELQSAWVELSADSTHWQILGPRRSGKTTLLRNIVLSLAERYTPQEVAFVLVDLMGEFVAYRGEMSLADLPHTLAVIGRGEDAPALVERMENLLSTPRAESQPIVVVVLDNYDDGRDELARPFDRLARLVRRRSDCGLHFVVASREQFHGDGFWNQVRFAQNTIALRYPDILRDLGDAAFLASAGKQKMSKGRGYVVRQDQVTLVQCAVPFDTAALSDGDVRRAAADAMDQWIKSIAQRWPAPAASIPGFDRVETEGAVSAQASLGAPAAARSTPPVLSPIEELPDDVEYDSEFQQSFSSSQPEPPPTSIEPEGLVLLARLRLIAGYAMMELLHTRSLHEDEIPQLIGAILGAWENPPALLHVLRSLAPKIIPDVQVDGLPADALIALLHEELRQYVVVDSPVPTDALVDAAGEHD